MQHRQGNVTKLVVLVIVTSHSVRSRYLPVWGKTVCDRANSSFIMDMLPY